MTTLPMPIFRMREARENLADIFNRVAHGGERIAVQRRGKEAVVVISEEDAAILEAMEDRADIAAVRRARKEKGSIPWGKAKEQLGL